MKKIICAMMALLLVLSMAACNGSDASQETAKPTTPTETTKPTEDATKPTAPTETTKPTESDKVFEKQVLVEDAQISVVITGVKNDPVWGYTLQVLVENKTDKNLMFSLDDVSVNGFMVDPLWAEEVAPGKRSNCEIHFSEKSFKDNGIETVEELEFVLRVYNAKDWNDEDIHNQKHALKMQ